MLKKVSKSPRRKTSLALLMHNENYIGKDGLVHNNWVGDQSAETVRKTTRELEKLFKQLRSASKPVLILADISRLGKVTSGGRHEGYRLMRYCDCDRAAIFGNYFLFKGLVEGIIMATGMGFRVKLFHNLDQALDWLKSSN